MHVKAALLCGGLFAAGPIFAQAPGTPPPTTEKTGSETAVPIKVGPVPVVTKWSTTFYGFIEAQFISDSTESFNETAGNTNIARPGTYAGTHQRLTISVRNSRLGFRINAPDFHRIRSSALVEVDFLGNQPPNATEGQIFTNPALRLRHGFLKVETDYVDVLIGQTWQLFGNQPYFDPAVVQLQGLPGQVYGRAPQLRLSHTFGGDPIAVEAAIAASKPPQRDAHAPDGQGALRLMLNSWKGVRTAGGTGTSVDPLMIAASGVVRRLAVPEFNAAQLNDVTATGSGFTVDVLLPIIRGTLQDRGNALTLNGSFANGTGYADLFTSLTGGIAFPANVPGGGAYNPNIDNGIVVYTADGVLHTVDWRAWIAGAQYYLPPDGKIWVSANFSQMYSGNAASLGQPATRVFNHSWFADGNIFYEPITPLRFGFEYAYFHQTYLDGMTTTNNRFQLSTWFIF